MKLSSPHGGKSSASNETANKTVLGILARPARIIQQALPIFKQQVVFQQQVFGIFTLHMQ